MVYKSPDYTRFIAHELATTRAATRFPVSVRIVANDPVWQVEDVLDDVGFRLEVPTSVYYDPKPSDYYLNRVYRCWNHCVQQSFCENVCLVNSDMLFDTNWLTNLIKYADEYLPTSLLVESGKLTSGTNAISKDFGRHPKTLDNQAFRSYSNELTQTNHNETRPGGLFMPCIFNRSKFLQLGGYPEGNIYNDGAGTRNGPVIQSGDAWFFDRYCSAYNVSHITVMDSVVYHIQEGEMDE